MPQLKLIPVDNIVSDPKHGGLREVQKEHERFPMLVESIANLGVLNPISVRYNETLGKYTVIDGHQRLAASQEAGLKEVPSQIFEVEDDDTMVMQIVGNLARIETKPVQYAKQLQRIIMMPRYQTYSRQELASQLGLNKSLAWLNNQLSLTDLIPENQKLVEEGLIPISNAYWLAKLPADEQIAFVEAAQNDDTGTFSTKVHSRQQELKAIKKGLSPEAIDPLASARGRKLGEIKKKYEEITAELSRKPDDPFLLGYYQGVAWAMQMDKATVEAKEAEKQAAKKAHEDKMKQRREEMKALQEKVQKLGGIEHVTVVEKK